MAGLLADALAGRPLALLSVHLLVEVTFEHNEASQTWPLHLYLVTNEAFLRVENTGHPRPAGLAPSTGTGTGIANVRQCYALLGAA